MQYRKRAAVVVVLAAAYWALLFCLTHASASPPSPVEGFDKLVHAGAYALLALLLCAAASNFWRFGVRVAIGVVLAVALYGAADELTQGLVEHRSPDAWDWVADLAGAVAGVAAFALVRWLLSSFVSAKTG
jgi:VanZ family protein